MIAVASSCADVGVGSRNGLPPDSPGDVAVHSGTPESSDSFVLGRRLLEYMNSKYHDDNFHYVSPSGGGLGYSERSIIVNSDRFPDARIGVRLSEVDGEDVFADNYHHFKFENQIRERLDEILAGAFSWDYKLFFGNPPLVGTFSFPAETTFEDYIANDRSSIMFTVVVSPDFGAVDRSAFEIGFNEAFAREDIFIVDAGVFFADETNGYNELENNLTAFLRDNSKLLYMNAWLPGTREARFEWS